MKEVVLNDLISKRYLEIRYITKNPLFDEFDVDEKDKAKVNDCSTEDYSSYNEVFDRRNEKQSLYNKFGHIVHFMRTSNCYEEVVIYYQEFLKSLLSQINDDDEYLNRKEDADSTNDIVPKFIPELEEADIPDLIKEEDIAEFMAYGYLTDKKEDASIKDIVEITKALNDAFEETNVIEDYFVRVNDKNDNSPYLINSFML
jgi:hypothetical protein